MIEKTIVSISGYGATGSSAVVDLLKGQAEIEVLDDFEFQLHYFPDGISDLDYKLNESCSRFYDSDLAIKRFLELSSRLDEWYFPAFSGHLREYAEEFINELNPTTWEGYWAYDRLMTPKEHIFSVKKENEAIYKRNARVHFINRILRKLHLPLFNDNYPFQNCYEERKLYMSLKPDNFKQAAQNFTAKLLRVASKENKPILAVNQLLPPQNPIRFYKYFPFQVKSIVVTRDPRDLWLHYHILKRSHHSPRKNVYEFVRWYKENMKESVNVIDDSILRIPFESIVYDYYNTRSSIFKFLGVPDEINGAVSFEPHKSAVNMRLFEKNRECQKEISIIEEELKEYLFDFSQYAPVVEDSSVKVF